MTEKEKTKRVVPTPDNPPDSFTREELLRAIKKVAAARKRRQKPAVRDGAK